MSILPHLAKRARADLALCATALAHVKQQAPQLRIKPSLTLAALAAATLCALPPAWSAVPPQAPRTALFDETATIPKGSVSLIEKAASSILRDDDVRLRFAFVRNVPYGESVNDYAKELATQWGLGDRDVLFVASPKLARAGAFVGVGVGLDGGIVKSVSDETFALKAGEEQYGGAWLDVCNRLIVVLGGGEDPGPPDLAGKEAVGTFKTKKQTESGKSKYITAVIVVLVIAFVAPLLQTYWYVKDD